MPEKCGTCVAPARRCDLSGHPIRASSANSEANFLTTRVRDFAPLPGDALVDPHVRPPRVGPPALPTLELLPDSPAMQGALGAVPLAMHFFASGGYTNKREVRDFIFVAAKLYIICTSVCGMMCVRRTGRS